MGYQEEYQESIEHPEQFWRRQAELIEWYEFPQTILSQDEQGFHRWFEGGKLNTSYLALDHQVETGRGDQLALIHDSPVTNSPTRNSVTRWQGSPEFSGSRASIREIESSSTCR